MSRLKADMARLRQLTEDRVRLALTAEADQVLSDAIQARENYGFPGREDLSEESQRTGQIRTRAEMLVNLLDGDLDAPQLANEVGLGSRQAALHHLQQLRDAGLVQRQGKWTQSPWTLTPQGKLFARMLFVWGNGEPIWRRLIRKHNGVYDRAFASRVEAAGRELDQAAAEWDGLRDRSGKLLRKATASACIEACKRHARWSAAAKDAGIEVGALEQRLKKLMKYGEMPKNG